MIYKPNPLLRWSGLFLIGAPAAFIGGALASRVSEALALCLIVLSGICFLLLVTAILYEVMTRLQWRILELLFTLVVGTLPMAILAPHDRGALHDLNSADIICLAVNGFAGMACTFTGSVAGMTWIIRLKEQRTFHRLGLMLLAWATILGAVAMIVGLVALGVMLFDRHQHWTTVAYCFSSCAILVPAVMVERRARAAELRERKRPEVTLWIDTYTGPG